MTVNGAIDREAAATVVTTVLGTGVILWVVQATQLAATFITATPPTWMQVDIAKTLAELAKEKTAKDEATAKIFESMESRNTAKFVVKRRSPSKFLVETNRTTITG